MEISGKASLGHLLSPVLSWERHCESVWGGDETCAWGRCGDLENGLFKIMLPWCLGGMCLNSIDSTFIVIHLEISTSKEQLAVHFPLIDTL